MDFERANIEAGTARRGGARRRIRQRSEPGQLKVAAWTCSAVLADGCARVWLAPAYCYVARLLASRSSRRRACCWRAAAAAGSGPPARQHWRQPSPRYTVSINTNPCDDYRAHWCGGYNVRNRARRLGIAHHMLNIDEDLDGVERARSTAAACSAGDRIRRLLVAQNQRVSSAEHVSEKERLAIQKLLARVVRRCVQVPRVLRPVVCDLPRTHGSGHHATLDGWSLTA